MARVEGAGGPLGKHINGVTRPESAAPRKVSPTQLLGIPQVCEGREMLQVRVPTKPRSRNDQRGAVDDIKPVVLLDEEGREINAEAAAERTRVAQAYAKKCRRNKSRGRQPQAATTWVFAGPPRYDGKKGTPWSSLRVRYWAADCVKWLMKNAGPGSRLGECALHQDEGAPHLHATVVVADERGRLGWNRVRNRFTVKGKTGQLLMSGLQDNFHAEVGRRFFLERGEVGSNREHAPVDRELGIRIRVEEEQRIRVEEEQQRERKAAAAGRPLTSGSPRPPRPKAADERVAAAAAAEKAADERATAAEKAADERETDGVRLERVFLETRDENENLHDEVGTLKDDLDQARKDLVAEADARDQAVTNLKVMVGVVRELRPTVRDLDGAAVRAGMENSDDRQWLRDQVERGRGRDR